MNLIKKAQDGNAEAFEELIKDQLKRMYRIAWSILENDQDAADAIQDTILKCWEKLGQLRQEEYFQTWLTRILINECKNLLKKRQQTVCLDELPDVEYVENYETEEWKDLMKILGEEVVVPQVVLDSYRSAIEQIKEMEGISENSDTEGMWTGEKRRSIAKDAKHVNKWIKPVFTAAAIFLLLLIVSGITVVSVKAYITHISKIKNMSDEEIVKKYETIFGKDSGLFSRPMTEKEEHRIFEELLDLYYEGLAEPVGEVGIIESREEYEGDGIVFCLQDGILYLPERELTEEEMLEYVEFWTLERYIDYEAYIKASNPDYYRSRLEQMTKEEIEEYYILYRKANTETMFETREYDENEWSRRKVLKQQYRYEGKLPEKKLAVIQTPEEYSGKGVAFCVFNCTIYLPQTSMTDEDILEIEDFETRIDYSVNIILKEINEGIRETEPHIDFIEREKVETLDFSTLAEEEIINQPWIQAYREVLEDCWEENRKVMESWGYEYDETRRATSIRFIYLNDDEIPEMVVYHGSVGADSETKCNQWNYLYTCKDGKAVLLSPGEDTINDWYNIGKDFAYVERGSLVGCYFYYIYGLEEYDYEADYRDNMHDNMFRVDHWDFETMTRTSTSAVMKLEHAVSGCEQNYEDAERWKEYYVNVTDIQREEDSSKPGSHKIFGEKVDETVYEAKARELWGGAQVTVLSVEDFDIFYYENDTAQALAKSYMKMRQE